MIAAAPAPERRRALRKALESGALLRFPGAFAPIVARLIERQGFDGAYVSGAALSADLGLPDIGLVTQSEVVGRAQAIAPSLHAARDRGCRHRLRRPPQTPPAPSPCSRRRASPAATSRIRRRPSAAATSSARPWCRRPRWCGRVRAAAEARRDPDFLLIARTDARAPEGLGKAIDRAKAYVDAGAAMIFPEALQDAREFEAFRAALPVPLMANMTEFGKSPLLSAPRARRPRLQSGDLPGHRLPPRHEGGGGRAQAARRERRPARPGAAHDDQGAAP